MNRKRPEAARKGDLLRRRHLLIANDDDPVGQMGGLDQNELRIVFIIPKVGAHDFGEEARLG